MADVIQRACREADEPDFEHVQVGEHWVQRDAGWLKQQAPITESMLTSDIFDRIRQQVAELEAQR
jgi:hypothetical protein